MPHGAAPSLLIIASPCPPCAARACPGLAGIAELLLAEQQDEERSPAQAVAAGKNSAAAAAGPISTLPGGGGILMGSSNGIEIGTGMEGQGPAEGGARRRALLEALLSSAEGLRRSLAAALGGGVAPLLGEPHSETKRKKQHAQPLSVRRALELNPHACPSTLDAFIDCDLPLLVRPSAARTPVLSLSCCVMLEWAVSQPCLQMVLANAMLTL